MILKCPYDSHVHWRSSGEMQCVLSLHTINNISQISDLKISSENYRGDWLIGYGWDQNKFQQKQFPTRFDLDKYFPHKPVIFTRVDGHAVWVNTEALKRAGLLNYNPNQKVAGGEVLFCEDRSPSGIFIDLAAELIQRHVPLSSKNNVEKYLLKGMELFHKSGVTHIRDMTCDEMQWNVQCELQERGLLKLAIEQNFHAVNPDEFSKALDLSIRAKQESKGNMRVRGVKIFYDGALGSEGALLSQEYQTRPNHFGLKLLEDRILIEMIRKTWESDQEISIHVIGDQAAFNVVKVAYDLNNQGIKGKLNLEHCELLNIETMLMMKDLNVTCHIQPCHWLSDKQWLPSKIGNLIKNAFPWAKLEEMGINFDFGSDSPIEPPDINKTSQAIRDAQEFGILPTQKDPLIYHQHSDSGWIPNCYSEWENDKLKKTVYNSEVVFKS